MNVIDLFDETLQNPDWDKVMEIPEFKQLAKTPHFMRWHKEGDPLTHTKLVVKEIDNFFNEHKDILNKYNMFIVKCAAIFHDIGKATTTYFDEEKQDYCCRNHGAEGAKMTRYLLWDTPFNLRENICALVRYHMELHHLLNKPNAKERLFKLKGNGALLMGLWVLALCDSIGSLNDEESALDKIKKYNELRPLITEANKEYEDKPFNKDKWSRIVVMIGLPGAGKSTLVERWLKNNVNDDITVLSRDKIRAELGFCKDGDKIVGTKQQEKEVSERFDNLFIQAIKKNVPIIIDNTNLKKKYRKAFINTLKKYGKFKSYLIEYVYVETDKLATNLERRNNDGFTEEKFKDIILNFDYPECDEYDEFTTETVNNGVMNIIRKCYDKPEPKIGAKGPIEGHPAVMVCGKPKVEYDINGNKLPIEEDPTNYYIR